MATQTLADRQLVGFDLETTSADPRTARIVTAAVVPAGGQALTWLADPGVPIPAEAAAIHGITTQRARAEGAPARDVAWEVRWALERLWAEGGVVVAYNASYDLTLLAGGAAPARASPAAARAGARPAGAVAACRALPPRQEDAGRRGRALRHHAHRRALGPGRRAGRGRGDRARSTRSWAGRRGRPTRPCAARPRGTASGRRTSRSGSPQWAATPPASTRCGRWARPAAARRERRWGPSLGRASPCIRRFARAQSANSTRRSNALPSKVRHDVPAAEHHDRVTVLADLFVGLTTDVRRRDHEPQVAVAQP